MNWKTTVSGILAAIGTGLAAANVLPLSLAWIGPLLAAVGQALLGLSASDKGATVKPVK